MTQRAARWLGFAIWAGVAASAVFWGLRLFATGPSLPPQAVAIAPQALSGGDVSRVLGAAPASAPATPVVPLAPASSRFALLGIVAPRGESAAAEGLALIAVDGKPPRALRVGARVDGDLVLQRVHARGVELGTRGGAPAFSLAAPALPPPGSATAPGGRPLPPPRVLPTPVPRVLPTPVPRTAPTPAPVTAPTPSIQPVFPDDEATGEPPADEVIDEEVPATSEHTPTRPGRLTQ